MNDRTITIVNEDGKEIKCEILFTYFSEEFNHHYVVFKAPEGNNAGAAIYVEEENGQGRLDQIENDEEWAMLEEVLNDWADKNYSESSCDCESCGSGWSGCSSCGSSDLDDIEGIDEN